MTALLVELGDAGRDQLRQPAAPQVRSEAEFLDALDEADREEGTSAEELFERLHRYG